ncbi:MAG: nucleotide exchange factor GrpE [Bacteroidota bacterium]|nr:nucleotide exchange factor GrpE [Bacteroidota bacterium]
MENKDNTNNNPEVNDDSGLDQTDNLNQGDQKTDTSTSSVSNENSANNQGDDATSKLAELNDKYLRLYSEFDNFRKRTHKEKVDYLKTANEEVLKAILPIIDDFERAIKANENVTDVNAIKEGVNLIHSKLKNTTQQKGLTSFDCKGEVFDADIMEAITHVPAPSDELKGKVVDELEKGYKLGDKVIRFAKVVVGS